MDKPKDGGQAFPQPLTVGPSDDVYPAYPGMTLRDYFAAHALAGLCTAQPQEGEWRTEPSGAAIAAYIYADAMIAARQSTIMEGGEG